VGGITTLAKASMEAYIRALGDELGQSASAATSSILDALGDAMIAASGTIYPSGALFNYFAGSFNFDDFPTSLTPTFDDEWVTSAVVIL